MEYKCFNKVNVEPKGTDITAIITEMHSLSQTIGMPVCAKVNGRNLEITPSTNVASAVRSYYGCY